MRADQAKQLMEEYHVTETDVAREFTDATVQQVRVVLATETELRPVMETAVRRVLHAARERRFARLAGGLRSVAAKLQNAERIVCQAIERSGWSSAVASTPGDVSRVLAEEDGILGELEAFADEALAAGDGDVVSKIHVLLAEYHQRN